MDAPDAGRHPEFEALAAERVVQARKLITNWTAASTLCHDQLVLSQNLPLLEGTRVLLIPSVVSRTNLSRTDPEALAQAAAILREMSDDCLRYNLGQMIPG